MARIQNLMVRPADTAFGDSAGLALGAAMEEYRTQQLIRSEAARKNQELALRERAAELAEEMQGRGMDLAEEMQGREMTLAEKRARQANRQNVKAGKRDDRKLTLAERTARQANRQNKAALALDQAASERADAAGKRAERALKADEDAAALSLKIGEEAVTQRKKKSDQDEARFAARKQQAQNLISGTSPYSKVYEAASDAGRELYMQMLKDPETTTAIREAAFSKLQQDATAETGRKRLAALLKQIAFLESTGDWFDRDQVWAALGGEGGPVHPGDNNFNIGHAESIVAGIISTHDDEEGYRAAVQRSVDFFADPNIMRLMTNLTDAAGLEEEDIATTIKEVGRLRNLLMTNALISNADRQNYHDIIRTMIDPGIQNAQAFEANRQKAEDLQIENSRAAGRLDALLEVVNMPDRIPTISWEDIKKSGGGAQLARPLLDADGNKVIDPNTGKQVFDTAPAMPDRGAVSVAVANGVRALDGMWAGPDAASRREKAYSQYANDRGWPPNKNGRSLARLELLAAQVESELGVHLTVEDIMTIMVEAGIDAWTDEEETSAAVPPGWQRRR